MEQDSGCGFRISSGCGNEEFAIFRPIRRGGRIRDRGRWEIYFRFLLSKSLGIYGKRWITETVFSVIKRKFGEDGKE